MTWIGTRAEREWLAAVRKLGQEVGRLADETGRIADALEERKDEAEREPP